MSLVPPAEQPELRRAVGEARIDKCDELRVEAEAVREIVEMYAAANAEDEGADAAAAAEATKRSASALLLCHGPERDMLERKIGMLLDYLGAQPAGAQAAGAMPEE